MHVVVLGAGYAGLVLTRLLEREVPSSADLTLVDESPAHLVQHELHRVIRRPALAAEISIPLEEVLERATVRVARVESVDTDERVVHLDDGTLEYDVGAVCLGAQTAFYGLEGVREHAIPLKSLDDALEVRRTVLERVTSSEGRARIVVGGAGLSGVQVAGELAELVDEEELDAAVVLAERFSQVAPNFPPAFQRAVAAALEGRGVDVRTDAVIVGADERHVELEGEPDLAYDAFVWTGGIRGRSALAGERPVVRSDLRLTARTFALGDAARVVDGDGQAVPASAQSAVREARTTAENVSRLVSHDLAGDAVFEPRLEQFTFDTPGWLVSVGDDAVAQVGPSVVTGAAATALKATVGVGYLSSVGAISNALDLVSSEATIASRSVRERAGRRRR
ncbi:NAD(P)/FAD-dependent oxidoreductase [Natronobiforma cellulositropha]|uniref:NAD(P)/FAD-dependent oxidoreductase n=1 Tax=Natronobiforma cellulositropha TaxID=1679076 RepID=UPI0021D6116D|nr:FAD-dependent oxidoreductase [Natronobiforma cellulositropha]